ncbi:MAG: hypothetical protein WC071_14065, partial [Victivallaceae bacterium]
TTGLKSLGLADYAWCRHPLAYLVEAADDISYRIVDFEDGHILGIVPYGEVEDLFMQIIGSERVVETLKKLDDPVRKVEFMRAKALGRLVGEILDCFVENHDKILDGSLQKSLLDLVPSASVMKKIEKRSIDDIYNYRRAVEIEAAGFELTEGLLDAFVQAANDIAGCIKRGGAAKDASYRSRKLLQLVPERYHDDKDPEWLNSGYVRLMNILDYISGMTDSYAVSLFKKIKGISLPGIMM